MGSIPIKAKAAVCSGVGFARVVQVAFGALGRAAVLSVWVARCAIRSVKLEIGRFWSLRRRPRLRSAAGDVAAGATGDERPASAPGRS